MPNLTALAHEGISGIHHSTIPPITPAAWSTFMTGCNPGKHGIFDFQGYNRQDEEAYIVNATNLLVPTLWQILSELGLRVAVVDLPMTYPPPRLNGVLISGLPTPNRGSIFTYPASLQDEIERHLGYPWPLLYEEEQQHGLHTNLEDFLDLMRRFIHSRGEAMLYLLQREPWDFAFIQFQCLDFLQHPFWKFLDPGHPAFSQEQYRKLAAEFFVPLDAMLGKLFAAAASSMGPETLRVVVSDHGFQRQRTRVELNHWLYQRGFLSAQNAPLSSWQRYAELLRRIDVFHLRKRLLSKSTHATLARILNQQMIDRKRSVAWAFSSFWGYLYFGSQASAANIERLLNCLQDWRDPQTGAPIVRAIHRAHTIYHGEALERLPDLIVEPMPGYSFASKTYFRSGKVFSQVKDDEALIGHHAPEGIYLLAGPNVRKRNNGHSSTVVDLQDLAPTLLYWMHLPVPQHMDGVVRAEWFDLATPPYAPEYAAKPFEHVSETILTKSEQEEIKARLRSLGYL